jgi:thiamine-phosphate pyrophosphorylase
MPSRCLFYYITDRTAFPGDEPARRRRLLEKIAEAARAGVDYIQLREKDLPARELESLAREAVRAVREAGRLATRNRQPATALLLNSRTDVALAAGADGVHLRSDDVSPQEVREIWKHSGASAGFDTLGQKSPLLAKAARSGAPQVSRKAPLVGVSCHTPAEVVQAAAKGATFAVFAPVFEKKDAPAVRPTGLAMLEQACQANIPVLALGGITLANAQSCLAAGAAGIAAIRLFQENDIAQVVRHLRS